MIARSALLLPLTLLTACEAGETTRVTINGGTGASNGTTVQAGSRGVKADIEIPGFARLADGMQVDGVRLYPGSSLHGLAVDGEGSAQGEKVAIRFTAPADRAKVADHFTRQFADARFQSQPTASGFAGKTADGEWFALDLTAAGAQTRGEFRMGKPGQ